MKESELADAPTLTGTVPASQPAAPQPELAQGPTFTAELTKFMADPMDTATERRFASMVLSAHFAAPVQLSQHGQVAASDVHQQMQMNLGVTTYMADGEKYIPAFTDVTALRNYLREKMPNVHLREFSFTTAELMDAATKLGIAGVLINPGAQSFPLSTTYWNYINRVMPVMEAPNSAVTILPLDPAVSRVVNAVVKKARQTRGVQTLWVTCVQLNALAAPAVAVIVDYEGEPAAFDRKYAAGFADLILKRTHADQDVLVGTLADEMGRTIAAQTPAVFDRTKRNGKGGMV